MSVVAFYLHVFSHILPFWRVLPPFARFGYNDSSVWPGGQVLLVSAGGRFEQENVDLPIDS